MIICGIVLVAMSVVPSVIWTCLIVIPLLGIAIGALIMLIGILRALKLSIEEDYNE